VVTLFFVCGSLVKISVVEQNMIDTVYCVFYHLNYSTTILFKTLMIGVVLKQTIVDRFLTNVVCDKQQTVCG
jgi:hypothetical protein